jgi:hypothetical protein
VTTGTTAHAIEGAGSFDLGYKTLTVGSTKSLHRGQRHDPRNRGAWALKAQGACSAFSGSAQFTQQLQ